MRITEPMTMVTDYLIAGQCVALAIGLSSRVYRGERRSIDIWVLAFLMTALAASTGGTAHGFRLLLGERIYGVLWTVTAWSIGAGATLTVIAGLRSTLYPDTDNPTSYRTGIRWLMMGILVSAVGVSLMVLEVSLHEHFNQNDLYHLIQMVGLLFLYQGVLLLHGLAE